MFTKNKFAQMDSISNLINTILETDTKAKMEELKGNQHKIDKNKNNKIDAHDFKILRGEKKVEESSHQAKTTMKHVKNPTAGEKAAAKDIKPGVAGYRDRIAMLKSAEARGGLKKEEVEGVAEVWKGHSSTVKNPNFNDELSIRRVNPVGKRLKSGKLSADERGSQERTKALIKYTQKRGGLAGPKGPLPEEQSVAEAAKWRDDEQVDEAKEPGFRSSYGLGKKSTVAKKPETYGKRVQGKGYDKPENERKAPEGNVAMTSMMPGHDERAAKFLARQAKGTLVKGKAQSAKQMEEVEEVEEASSHQKYIAKMRNLPPPRNPGLSSGKMPKQAEPKADPTAHSGASSMAKKKVEEMNERELSKGETVEKERIVKGMKKNLAGFKSRYGEKAKSVMYATATKAAKEQK